MSGPFTEDPWLGQRVGSVRPGVSGHQFPGQHGRCAADLAPPGYPLDNDDPLAAAHHRCLSTLLDPFSIWRTRELFAPDGGLRGRRCLDVGAGVGARYARWLADQVGDIGQVVAFDVKPRDIPAHPWLTVLTRDLTGAPDADPTDEPDPLGQKWDFIHARLVLAHLPARRQLLTRLVNALEPGGRLLVEDWDTSRASPVLAAPTPAAAELYTFVQETVGRLFAIAGTDHTWARRVHPALRNDGLVDVHTIMFAESWTGGGPGAQLVAGTISQLQPALLAAGLPEGRLDQLRRLLADPRLVLAGHPLHSTSGRRPSR